MFKSVLTSYFSFTKKERNGIAVVFVLILLFTALPYLYPYFTTEKQYDQREFEQAVAALQLMEPDSAKQYSYPGYEKNDRPVRYPSPGNYQKTAGLNAELFEFDPNTLPAGGWKRLGLRDKTITTIENYLNKGGKFYKPEDIGRIWGLHEDEVQRLLPYVKISGGTAHTYANNYSGDKPAYEKITYKKERKPVDINSGDSLAFLDLPGIGPGFARRIINFRNKLGGFVSVNQVAETFGLPDSTFQKIKPMLISGSGAVKQININSATIDELKAHPYIRYAIGNAIVQYRSQHGNFSSVNDVKKIMLITEDIFIKIAPYLKTTD
jgi:DNA uptake protein ComE-like DNA-binding protein